LQEKSSVTTPSTGLKFGTSGGFQLTGQTLGSKLTSGGTSEKSGLLFTEKSGLLTEQQSSLSATIKSTSESEAKPTGGFKLPTVIYYHIAMCT